MTKPIIQQELLLGIFSFLFLLKNWLFNNFRLLPIFKIFAWLSLKIYIEISIFGMFAFAGLIVSEEYCLSQNSIHSTLLAGLEGTVGIFFGFIFD